MDFTSSSAVMGKPALNDLKSGLATAPVLYAAEEYPELSPMILRRFKNPGDVELAERLVFQSKGLQRTRELAAEHCQLAVQAVMSLSVFNTLVLFSHCLDNLCRTSACTLICTVCSYHVWCARPTEISVAILFPPSRMLIVSLCILK